VVEKERVGRVCGGEIGEKREREKGMGKRVKIEGEKEG